MWRRRESNPRPLQRVLLRITDTCWPIARPLAASSLEGHLSVRHDVVARAVIPNRPNRRQRKRDPTTPSGAIPTRPRFGFRRPQPPKPRGIARISRALPGCTGKVSAFADSMAEREGFEPSIGVTYTPLAGARLQPLGHLSGTPESTVMALSRDPPPIPAHIRDRGRLPAGWGQARRASPSESHRRGWLPNPSKPAARNRPIRDMVATTPDPLPCPDPTDHWPAQES